TLPDYMLPRHVVVLDTMPLLPNDKIDRKALPAPTGISAAPSGRAPSGPVGQTASAPVTELQRRVAESMAAVLGLPEVSAEQNFFELGGHSLLAARLATNLISVAGRRPSLREIFEA